MYGVLKLSPVNTIFILTLRIVERLLKLISENKSYKEAYDFVNGFAGRGVRQILANALCKNKRA